jgi:signal transduction histidine kinase
MFGRLGVRGKILAVVAVPILVLLIAAGAVTFSAARTLDSSQNTAQLLTVVEAAADLATALEDERDASTNFVDSFTQSDVGGTVAEAAVDSAYLALRSRVQALSGADGAAALDVLARVDATLGLRLDTEPGTGFVTVTSYDTIPADELTGIYAVRAITYSNRVQDWPAFPTETEAAAREGDYAQISRDVLAISLTATPAGGVQEAVNALLAVVDAEAAMAVLAAVPGTLVDDIVSARSATDAALGPFSDAVANVSDRAENSALRTLLENSLDRLTGLEVQRATVRDRVDSAATVSSWYRDRIQPLVTFPSVLGAGLGERTLARSLTATAAIGELVDALRIEGIESESVIRRGEFANQSEATQLANTQVRTDVALENAQAAVADTSEATPLPGYGASYDSVARSGFTTMRFVLTTGENALVGTLSGQQGAWSAYVQQELERSYLPAYDSVWSQAKDESAANVRSALLQTLFTALAAALVVLASLFIALLIARRIVRPLRRLTTTATAVRQELPRLVERVALPGQSVDVSEVQIPVESADEIGRLAEAFNAVNAATLAIAGEQAALRGSISEMFVNVARRDQVLLNRQLASIDEMERTQDDPETLMRLFALDHLATRMRRNSESLLVLAGIDSGRRMRRPMPLSDVIRTASSEIELYERVELVLDADPSMVGHSALTAGHLFAELLENATVFSDPDTKVVVRTTEKDGSFVVEIVDMGIGMTPEELRQANARVVSSAASEILGAQRLGLFVVGRIARRIGARVELESEEGKGTTATVVLPRSLFDTSADADRSVPQRSSATDGALNVPSALLSHSEDEEVDDYSASVTSRAIIGNRPKALESAAAGSGSSDTLDDLIHADVESAPTSEEVDLAALTTGVTASGLPSRRRGGKSPKGAGLPETTTILGLPERPTTGQLNELERQRELEGEFGAPVTERRTAIFRSFRARGADVEAPSDAIPALVPDGGGLARDDAGASAPKSEPVGTVPGLEPEPKPEAEIRSAPVFEPQIDAEVALGGEVKDNGDADTPAPSDDWSLSGGRGPSLVEDGLASDAEPSDAKPGDEKGLMAPGWSLGQDPAISNGFSHGEVLAEGDGPADRALSEPLAIPGLEPATDDAAVFEPSDAGARDTDFSAQGFPELGTSPGARTNENVAAPAGSAFRPVHETALASANLDALLVPSKAPAAGAKKRRGLFGRRRKDDEASVVAPAVEAYEAPAVEAYEAPAVGAYEAPAVGAYEAPAVEAYEAPAVEAYEAPALEAYEAPALEAFDVPALEAYEVPALEAYEAPALEAYGAPALEAYEAPAPAREDPVASAFGDWTVAPVLPSEVESGPTFAMPEALEVDPVAYAEPQAYAIPDVTEPSAQAEPFEVNYDVASYGTPSNPEFAAPGTGSLEIPTITSAPIDYGFDSGEAVAPAVEDVYAEPPQLEETAAAQNEPETEIQPVWQAFATEAHALEVAIPELEFEPEPAPAPKPDYAQYAQQPEYPAVAAYDTSGAYGAPAPSPDQFAQPWGWEAAGADALQAANYEPDYRGYSPEAFSAPPPVEDYEADVATAVFSELRSLSSERPTIQRTRAGLTRRERSAVATVAPVDVEPRAADRDPETVRANFAGFYTGTTRGRADAAAQLTDVRGSLDNEVTP